MTSRAPGGRPVWAEISEEALQANYQKLLQAASSGPQAGLLPVVKANAYGHDVGLCAPLLAAAGARWLGVTGVQEGLEVRALCPEPEILLMSGICAGEAEAALEHRLTPVVWEISHLDLLEEAASLRRQSPGTVPVHLEIDTGMSRQGVRLVSPDRNTPELAAMLGRFHSSSSLRLAGILTHFSASEILFSDRANPQMEGFSAALDCVRGAGLTPEWLHAGNSSTLAAGPDRERLAALAERIGASLMVRPGLALYGYLDRITRDEEAVPAAKLFAGAPPDQSLRPVLTWKASVTSLRSLRPGETVGYDNTFTAQRTTRLALLPVGYADGVNRLLSNRGHVLVRGRRAPIAGRISMDQMVIDVTDIPSVSVGDEALLIGSQGEESITAWEIADAIGSIPWEVLCAISARVPRIRVL